VDLMEKYIPAGTAKLLAMDKIVDKPWKTLRVYHSLSHNFIHNHQQAFPSWYALSHKLHNNYCCDCGGISAEMFQQPFWLLVLHSVWGNDRFEF